MTITSRNNEMVKRYTKIASSKKYRRETGLFCLEGARLVADALKNEIVLSSIMATEKCLQKYHDLLLDYPLIRDRIIIISDSVSEKLSSVEHPQGIYALARQLDKNLDTDTIKENGKYLALCSIQDPGNLGTMIRTADALGIDGILFCGTCDIYNPKVVRSTMGSLFRIRFLLCDEIVSLTKELNQAGVQTFAAVLDESAVPIQKCNFSGPSILYIGNEGSGLSIDIVSVCSQQMTIHMKGNAESLNAASAAAIAMWEMTKGE